MHHRGSPAEVGVSPPADGPVCLFPGWFAHGMSRLLGAVCVSGAAASAALLSCATRSCRPVFSAAAARAGLQDCSSAHGGSFCGYVTEGEQSGQVAFSSFSYQGESKALEAACCGEAGCGFLV